MTNITNDTTPAKLLINRMEAQEYRRRLAQGLGRPIVSYEKDGKRYVQVGVCGIRRGVAMSSGNYAVVACAALAILMLGSNPAMEQQLAR
jgi:hypothetical protein